MGSGNTQKDLKNEKNHVKLTYEVDSDGATVQKELGMAAGVVGDFSGDNKDLPHLSERHFIEIDKKNFDEVLKSQKPEIDVAVENKIADDGSMSPVKFSPESMKDFTPDEIAEKYFGDILQMVEKFKIARQKCQADPKLEQAFKTATDPENQN
jgi:type VI secretion system protein ImpB